jgi:hypothetical protein
MQHIVFPTHADVDDVRDVRVSVCVRESVCGRVGVCVRACVRVCARVCESVCACERVNVRARVHALCAREVRSVRARCVCVKCAHALPASP